jgi:hypothetical protein
MLMSKTKVPDICTQNQRRIQSNDGVGCVLGHLCTFEAPRASPKCAAPRPPIPIALAPTV